MLKDLKLKTLKRSVWILTGVQSEHMNLLLLSKDILTLPNDYELDDKLFNRLI